MELSHELTDLVDEINEKTAAFRVKFEEVLALFRTLDVDFEVCQFICNLYNDHESRIFLQFGSWDLMIDEFCTGNLVSFEDSYFQGHSWNMLDIETLIRILQNIDSVLPVIQANLQSKIAFFDCFLGLKNKTLEEL